MNLATLTDLSEEWVRYRSTYQGFDIRPLDKHISVDDFNGALDCATMLSITLQVLIVQFGGDIFSTRPLTAQQWGACTGIGAITLLVRAVLRLIPPHPQEICAAGGPQR